MYCIIKCIVQGKQARVKNADFPHPSCTVVMSKHKSASPVLNVLSSVKKVHILYSCCPATSASWVSAQSGALFAPPNHVTEYLSHGNAFGGEFRASCARNAAGSCTFAL